MNNDWYSENAVKLEPFIGAKRQALHAHKDQPSKTTLSTLRSARNQARAIVQECVNDYGNKLSSSIQQASDTGNVKVMLNGIKKLLVPPSQKPPH